MIVLDGKTLSLSLREKLKTKVLGFQREYGKIPGLAVILTGHNEASHIYVKRKITACREAGFQTYKYEYPEKVSREELIKKIRELNNTKKVHGILIQLPLPDHLNEEKILSLIKPEKDPDGLTPENRGLLWSGRPRIVPCTAFGVITLLNHYNIPLAGKKAVVIGRSQIVGLPTAAQLLQHQATVTICHSRTQNLSHITAQGDIVVVSAGKKELLSKKDFKKGAVVVDVGIHREIKTGKNFLTGDVNTEGLEDHLKALSPVPGGVGPMTVAMLLENTFLLAESQEKKRF